MPTQLSESNSELQTVVPYTTRKSLRSHQEKHLGNGDIVRDVIIGFADGLTVPFALTAGLSS